MEPQLATFGVWELVIILIIVLVIFGGAKLPELMGSLGKSIKIFKKSIKEDPREIKGEARRVESGPTPEQLPPGETAKESQNLERAEDARVESTADRK